MLRYHRREHCLHVLRGGKFVYVIFIPEEYCTGIHAIAVILN